MRSTDLRIANALREGLRLRQTRSGLHKTVWKAIGLPFDRWVEHLEPIRIIRVGEQRAFRIEDEAGRLHRLSNGRGLDAMEDLRRVRSGPDCGGVVHVT